MSASASPHTSPLHLNAKTTPQPGDSPTPPQLQSTRDDVPDDTVGSLSKFLCDHVTFIDDEVLVEDLEGLSSNHCTIESHDVGVCFTGVVVAKVLCVLCIIAESGMCTQPSKLRADESASKKRIPQTDDAIE